MNGILGIKKAQTQKFRVDGSRIPVTIVEVNANPVVSIKTAEKDGYWAVQLGYGTAKKPSQPMRGHVKGANLDKAPQFLKEVRMVVDSADEMPKVGDFVSLTEVLEEGDVIDVTGTSKGKGFAGGVKRYHFRGGPATHGQSDRHRAPGSIGAGTTPGRVYKGKRMAGKMGFETVTVKNLTVAGIDGNTLFIAGLIPGKLGALISVKKTSKKDKKYADLIEIAEKKAAIVAEEAKKAEEEAAKVQAEAPVEPVVEMSAEPVQAEEKNEIQEAEADVLTEAVTEPVQAEEAKAEVEPAGSEAQEAPKAEETEEAKTEEEAK